MPPDVVFMIPHGADSIWLKKTYKSFRKHITPELETYMNIEMDKGATEIAEIASHLIANAGLKCTTFLINYNRGILDGGRIPGHEKRTHAPSSFAEEFKEELTKLHLNTTNFISQLFRSLPSHTTFIDLHTMAPTSPSGFDKNKSEHYVSSLTEYNSTYLTNNNGPTRPINILSHDENGKLITDAGLNASITEAFSTHEFRISNNEPFSANSKYMMNRYLKLLAGTAIDFPKHLVAKGNLSTFKLDEFEICPKKVEKISRCLATGILNFKKSKLCMKEN